MPFGMLCGEIEAILTALFVAMAGRTDLNGRTVLLVDDIMTTGATISDGLRALRETFPEVKVQIYTLGWAGER